MSHPQGTNPADLERFRSYLRLLASLQLGGRLQGKLEPSDLVQESLLKAYENLPSFVGNCDAELAAWLRKILANTLTDAVRRCHAERRDIDLEKSIENTSVRIDNLLGASGGDPVSALMHQEQLVVLSDALASLPEDQRKAVELKYLQGMSLMEIGESLARSRASVAGLLRRGLEHLRERLGDEKVFDERTDLSGQQARQADC